MTKTTAFVATAAILACAAIPGLAEEIPFETTASTSLVIVPPSWTESGPPRLRLYGPDGTGQPVALFARLTPSHAASSIFDVRREAGMWLLEVAAPSVPQRPGEHCSSGLELELEGARTVWDEVAVEVDGQLLAQGRLFALDDERSTRLELSWPSATAASVRLALPATAPQAPEVRAVRVLPCATSPGVELAITSSCSSRGHVECLAVLPAQPLDELVVDFGAATPEVVSWRLSTARAGRWSAHGEGRSTTIGGALVLRTKIEPGAAVRIEVAGSHSAQLRGRGPGVFFPVVGVGMWRVVRESGSGSWATEPWPESPEAAWLALDLPPATAVPAAGEAAAARPAGRGARLEGNFTQRWPIAAPTGTVAALELAPTVQVAARADFADLRLVQDGFQVPYRRETLAKPAVASEAFALVPQPCGERRSCIEFDLADGGMALSSLELVATGPFDRNFEVRLHESDQPGRPGGDRVLATGRAHCPWQDSLPCRTATTLDLTTPAHLTIAFEDGDAAPLLSVDATVWQTRQQLIFVAPGPLDLVAGDPNLDPPRYDPSALAAIGPPTTNAILGPGQAWHPTSPTADRLILLGALGAAAIVLLLVLRRQLAA